MDFSLAIMSNDFFLYTKETRIQKKYKDEENLLMDFPNIESSLLTIEVLKSEDPYQ